ncbi:MAG: GFA family protein [Steroidobacteraceae bacterium]
MIRGGCLCGAVRFEVVRLIGPFELCHCSRCRKASGSAFLPWLSAHREDFKFLQGEELLRRYEAPLRDTPPPYRTCFCGRCGSPVPDLQAAVEFLEVHAGVLDDDPVLRPERHILVEAKSPWFRIYDELPQLDRVALSALRSRTVPPPFSVERIDHVVFRVRSIDASVSFYESVLGCKVVRSRPDLGLVHIRAGASMVDLVAIDGKLGRRCGKDPVAGGRNVDHLCLRVEPFDEKTIVAHLAKFGIQPSGPAGENFGAEGDGLSLSFQDPDGNIIELKGPGI